MRIMKLHQAKQYTIVFVLFFVHVVYTDMSEFKYKFSVRMQ